MPQVYQDEQVMIELVGPLGSYANNTYIIRPASGGPAAVVDVPEGFEAVLEALGNTPVSRVIVTHSHFDHWAGYDVMTGAIDAPVYVGAEETNIDTSRPVERVRDGETIDLDGVQIQVLHTPGHTPGSICLLVNKAVLTGDTLFPGGPGRTRSPEDLRTEIDSIVTRLHTLEDDVLVLPGHGDSTTIRASKEEYADFASREHPEDLHGDVLWAES